MSKRRPQKNFTQEFKLECVRHYLGSDLKQEEVAKNLGVSRASLGKWVREYRENHGAIGAMRAPIEDNREELKRLREEVRQLRMERDILKKAARFFANNP